MTAELGALLVKAGKITQQQLAKALEIQKQTNGKLGQVLVQMGAIPDENEISEFVGRQLNIGALRLSDLELNPEVVKLIPLDIARKFNVIAISKLGKTLVVAISDPNNIYVLDAVKFITGCTVQPVISPEKAIQKAIETQYQDSGGLKEILDKIEVDNLEVIEAADETITEQDRKSVV